MQVHTVMTLIVHQKMLPQLYSSWPSSIDAQQTVSPQRTTGRG